MFPHRCTYILFVICRNLDVGEDKDIGEDEDEEGGNLVAGLHCKVVVQFEGHKDFCNALKVLCGRSLIKVARDCAIFRVIIFNICFYLFYFRPKCLPKHNWIFSSLFS